MDSDAGAFVRRTIDVTVAAVGLVLLAAPMLLIGLAVRLTSHGPALFTQRRVGLGGRTFTLHKFRTTRTRIDPTALHGLIIRRHREDERPNDLPSGHDPRLTPIGAVLRNTGLDELPQLINLLRGDLSLVGPRPCLEWEAHLFPARFWQRFAVRPGLTGLWQLGSRPPGSTLDMLQSDLIYVRTRNLRGDLSILTRTLTRTRARR